MRKWELEPVAKPKQIGENQARRRMHNADDYNALVVLVREQPGIPIVAAAWKLWTDGAYPNCKTYRDVQKVIDANVTHGYYKTVRKAASSLEDGNPHSRLYPTEYQSTVAPVPPLRARDVDAAEILKRR